MIQFYDLEDVELHSSGDTLIARDPDGDIYYYVRIDYDRAEDFYEITIIEEVDRGGYHQRILTDPVYVYSQDDAIDAAWDVIDEFQDITENSSDFR